MMKVLIKRQDTPVGSGTGGNTAVTPPTVVTPIPVGNTPTSPTTIPVNTPGSEFELFNFLYGLVSLG